MKTEIRHLFALGAILMGGMVFAHGPGANCPCPQGFHGHEPHHHGKHCGRGQHHWAHHHWGAPAQEAGRANPVPATVLSVQSGARIYQQHCAACHGASRLGDGPLAAALPVAPANLTMMAPHLSDGELAWKIAEGRGVMPGWRSVLSERQIWDVVNYLKATGDPS